MTILTLLFLSIALLAFGVGGRFLYRAARHRRALTRLLDSADAFEARLRAARGEIEAVTGEEDESVRAALQEMLRQRLWLQQHGPQASFSQLDEIRRSIDAARLRIDQQLNQIERARIAMP